MLNNNPVFICYPNMVNFDFNQLNPKHTDYD